MDEWRLIVERLERLERWRSSVETRESTASVGASNLQAGWCYAGQVTNPPTLAKINTAFGATFGRAASDGDLVTLTDTSYYTYVLVYHAYIGAWLGMSITSGGTTAGVKYS